MQCNCDPHSYYLLELQYTCILHLNWDARARVNPKSLMYYILFAFGLCAPNRKIHGKKYMDFAQSETTKNYELSSQVLFLCTSIKAKG